MRSLRKLCLLIVFTLVMCLSFVMVGISANTAEADTLSPDTFEMDNSASAKLSDVEGLRFRVKLDTTTKNAVNNGDATLTFVVTPKLLVSSADDFKTVAQKITLVADKDKFYQEDGDSNIWYANCVITSLKDKKLDLACVAFITDGETTIYTSNYTYNNMYSILNSAIKDENDYSVKIFQTSGLYSWFGTESYPLFATTQSEYNSMIKRYYIATHKENGLYISVESGITTNSEFGHIDTSYIVTFNDYNGNLLKKVMVPAGGTVSSFPTVATSEENKMIDGYVYNGKRAFTTSTTVYKDITATANLVSYYEDTTPFAYDQTNGTEYKMPEKLESCSSVVLYSSSADKTMVGSDVNVAIEGNLMQIPANLGLTVGSTIRLKITGLDEEGNECRILKTFEVVDHVDVIIDSATDFDNWYKISNYSTIYDASQYVVLTANIDLTGYSYGWVNASYDDETKYGTKYSAERSKMLFNGTFNGQGYNIDNFTTYYGFVGTTAEGTIKNVSFTNVYNSGVAYGGGFFAKDVLGTISNVYYSGKFRTGTASKSSGIMYQCHNAVNVENFVVVLNADETITTPELGFGIANYAKDWSSMYIVDEVFNPTVTSNTKIVNAGVTDNSKYNFYDTFTSFKADVVSLPDGFSSSFWTIDSTLGLVFKSALVETEEEEIKSNNYFDNMYKKMDMSLYATYNAEKSAEIGMDVYSKTLSAVDNAVVDSNSFNLYTTDSYSFNGWSYAIMSTADTSLIYANGVKLTANKWYYIHVKAVRNTGAYVYVSESKYGTYTDAGINDAYETAKSYTCMPKYLTMPKNGTFSLTLYVTNFYYDVDTFDTTRTEVSVDDVVFTAGNTSAVTFDAVGTQTVASTLVDGTESGTQATFANNKITIPASVISALESGEHTIVVKSAAKIYTVKVIIADVAISNATEFHNWYKNVYLTAKASSAYVILTDNIVLDGATTYSTSGTTFSGTFNGQGHYISNLKTTNGMFYTLNGTFKNTAVVNTTTTVDTLPFIGYNGTNAKIYNVLYQGVQNGDYGNRGNSEDRSQSGAFYGWISNISVENVVVNVNRACGANSDPVTPYATLTQGAKNLYVINNCSTGSTDDTAAHYYASNNAYLASVTSHLGGFDSDIWTYKPGYGMTFKSMITENDYFDNSIGHTSSITVSKEDATLVFTEDTTYNIGLPIYKNKVTSLANDTAYSFYRDYTNLKKEGYIEWSFAIMSTADTSLIYSNAVKLSANTWYYIHVVLEDYEYNSQNYKIGQVYVATSQYGTYTKVNLSSSYLVAQDGAYTCQLNNLIHPCTGEPEFDIYMTDIYALA